MSSQCTLTTKTRWNGSTTSFSEEPELFDREGIIDHLRELDEALRDWERYQCISMEELRTDRDKRNMVMYALLVAIQAAIDVANHLVAEHHLRKPSTYRETFENIVREGNSPPSDLATELSDLTGFRNVLAHAYWRINVEEVYNVLKNDLGHLKKFLTRVKEMLKGCQKI